MKPKLLFLSAHLPSPNATQAGQLTAYRNLSLLAVDYDVHLIAYRNEVELSWDLSPLYEVCSSIKIVDITYRGRLKNLIYNFYLPFQVSVRTSSVFKKNIIHISSMIDFSRVHFEWSQTIVYASLFSNSVFKSLYVHDVLSQAAVRKISVTKFFLIPFYIFELFRIFFWERIALRGLDTLYAPSEKDKKILNFLSPDSIVKVVPLSFKLLKCKKNECQTDHLTLLYWGSFARAENVDAALYLVNKIFPIIVGLGMPCKLLILGSNPPLKLRKYASPDIVIPGYMENPANMFSLAHLAVFPIRFGAGVKVKVLEALSAGLPVVTTHIGSEGIPCSESSGLFTIDELNPEKFVTKMLAIYNDKKLMRSVSLNAIKWASEYAEVDAKVLCDR